MIGIVADSAAMEDGEVLYVLRISRDSVPPEKNSDPESGTEEISHQKHNVLT